MSYNEEKIMEDIQEAQRILASALLILRKGNRNSYTDALKLSDKLDTLNEIVEKIEQNIYKE